MEKIVKEGKNLDDLLNEIKEELNVSEDQILYSTYEKKGGLFKGTTTVCEAITYDILKDELKEFLLILLANMGLEVTFEAKSRENQILINMNSNNTLISFYCVIF